MSAVKPIQNLEGSIGTSTITANDRKDMGNLYVGVSLFFVFSFYDTKLNVKAKMLA